MLRVKIKTRINDTQSQMCGEQYRIVERKWVKQMKVQIINLYSYDTLIKSRIQKCECYGVRGDQQSFVLSGGVADIVLNAVIMSNFSLT